MSKLVNNLTVALTGLALSASVALGNNEERLYEIVPENSRNGPFYACEQGTFGFDLHCVYLGEGNFPKILALKNNKWHYTTQSKQVPVIGESGMFSHYKDVKASEGHSFYKEFNKAGQKKVGRPLGWVKSVEQHCKVGMNFCKHPHGVKRLPPEEIISSQ